MMSEEQKEEQLSESTMKFILEKMQETQHEIVKAVQEINLTLARQEESLRLHVYRTGLAEENIKMLRAEMASKDESLQKQIEPIQNHIIMVQGSFKTFKIIASVVGFIGASVASVVGILRLFR
jgi:hypothetical protein